MADVTGIPRTTLRRRLAGKQAFDLDDLHVLAEALGVHVLEFFATSARRAS